MTRVQRSRAKGARLSPGTLCCTRPGEWANLPEEAPLRRRAPSRSRVYLGTSTAECRTIRWSPAFRIWASWSSWWRREACSFRCRSPGRLR